MTERIHSFDRFQESSNHFGVQMTESLMRNDRQVVFALARKLVYAQFELGDQELTNRLWQDVLDRQIDIQRVTNLMYGCSFHEEEEAMLEADLAYERITFE